MKYYIAENGQQAGPFEPNELLLHGLTVNSLVWCEGMANWTSASQVPELMAILSGQPIPTGIDTQLPQTPPMGDVPLPQMPPVNTTPQTTAPQQPAPYGTPNQPYAPPQYGPSNTTPRNQMMPKTWLTESIVATVVCTLCCGAWFFTLITGIIAIFNANGVKTKFNSGDYAGAEKKSASAKLWTLITAGIGVAAALYSAYMLISNPELLQQIQEGSGLQNLYPFLK